MLLPSAACRLLDKNASPKNQIKNDMRSAFVTCRIKTRCDIIPGTLYLSEMQQEKMEKLIERLESCVKRLETTSLGGGASSSSSASAASASASASAAGSSSKAASPFVEGYDEILGLVEDWAQMSQQIGDLVAQQVRRF